MHEMEDKPSLFDLDENDPDATRAQAPLADQMRPEEIDEVVGMDDLLRPGRFLRSAIASDRVPSVIFWGPPGSGKTTLAHIISRATRSRFVPFSAVTAGIREVKAIMEEARRLRRLRGTNTIVFIDEIHRFNRAQQDAFLPYVETGDIVLIGATTENPSFEVNSALLSRCKVVIVPPLTTDGIETILRRALLHPSVTRHGIALEDDVLAFIAATAGGDARQALTSLQLIVETADRAASPVRLEMAREILNRKSLLYDKSGEEHFNIISALHKSIRNSDPDASVYWLARMLEGGEDPLYVARRLVRAAAEDIGLADPEALRLAVAAKEATHFIGMPEAGVVLAELAIYLALAPKSNSVYKAWGKASREVLQGDTPPVPLHLRNAPTRLMKDVGYGKGYEYAHDLEEGTSGMECLPDSLRGTRFFEPGSEGREEALRRRRDEIERVRAELRKKRGP